MRVCVCAYVHRIYYSLSVLQVGGVEEYEIAEAVKSGRIFKPIVAWCIGTCAKMFTSEVKRRQRQILLILCDVCYTHKHIHITPQVQFGHAGACANAERETADAKNKV